MMKLVKLQGKWEWFEDGKSISPQFTSKVKAQDWFWDTFVGV